MKGLFDNLGLKALFDAAGGAAPTDRPIQTAFNRLGFTRLEERIALDAAVAAEVVEVAKPTQDAAVSTDHADAKAPDPAPAPAHDTVVNTVASDGSSTNPDHAQTQSSQPQAGESPATQTTDKAASATGNQTGATGQTSQTQDANHPQAGTDASAQTGQTGQTGGHAAADSTVSVTSKTTDATLPATSSATAAASSTATSTQATSVAASSLISADVSSTAKTSVSATGDASSTSVAAATGSSSSAASASASSSQDSGSGSSASHTDSHDTDTHASAATTEQGATGVLTPDKAVDSGVSIHDQAHGETVVSTGVSAVHAPGEFHTDISGATPAVAASTALLDAHETTSATDPLLSTHGQELAAATLDSAKSITHPLDDTSSVHTLTASPDGHTTQDTATQATPESSPVQAAPTADGLTAVVTDTSVTTSATLDTIDPALSTLSPLTTDAAGNPTDPLLAVAPLAVVKLDMISTSDATGTSTTSTLKLVDTTDKVTDSTTLLKLVDSTGTASGAILATGTTTDGVKVLAVASNLYDEADLVAAASPNVLTVVYDGASASPTDIITQIATALEGQKAESIAFASHNDYDNAISLTDTFKVTNATITTDTATQQFFQQAGALLADGGRLDFLACDVTAGADGVTLVNLIQQYSGHDVAASSNPTGNAAAGGDWILETGGVNALATYFDATKIGAYEGVMTYAPTFTGGGAVAYLAENTVNVTPQLIATGVSVSDADSPNFDGGYLKVEWTGTVSGSEQLTIRNQGMGADQIGVSGNNIYYSGVLMGTIDNTLSGNGSDLQINLNSYATPSRTTSLIQNLEYQDATNTGSSGTTNHTFDIKVNDGTVTGSTNMYIETTNENDAPTLTEAAIFHINEDPTTPQYELVSNLLDASFSDPDLGVSAMSGVAVVGNSVNESTEGQWMYSSDAGSTWRTIGTSVSDTSALILDSSTEIRFDPVANYNGTPGSLVVRALDDTYSGFFSQSAGGDLLTDVSTNGGSTPISGNTQHIYFVVDPVADAPSVSGIASTITYAENTVNAEGQLFASSAVVNDPDGENFADGYVKVHWNAGNSATSSFSVENFGNSTGEIGFGGSDVLYEGVKIGEVDPSYDGQAGTDFKINLNSAADVTAVQALVRALEFTDTSNDPSTPYTSHAFDVVVNDGTGLSGSQLVTIRVTPENDAPSLTGDASFSMTEDPSTPQFRTVSTLFDPQFSDPDTSQSPHLSGVAVTYNYANPVTEGVWMYSTDLGTTWKQMDAITGDNHAVALSSDTEIRFAPVANFSGTPGVLYVRALDDTFTGTFSTSDGSTVFTNVSTNGEGTAVSSVARTLSVNVLPEADAPSANDAFVNVPQNVTVTFNRYDFPFFDPDSGDTLTKVRIVSLPSEGTLYALSSPVTANQLINLEIIDNEGLTYVPPSTYTGNEFTSFDFKVVDSTAEESAAATLTLHIHHPTSSSNNPAGGGGSSESSSSSSTPATTTTDSSTTTQTTTTSDSSTAATTTTDTSTTTFVGAATTADTSGSSSSTTTTTTTTDTSSHTSPTTTTTSTTSTTTNTATTTTPSTTTTTTDTGTGSTSAAVTTTTTPSTTTDTTGFSTSTTGTSTTGTSTLLTTTDTHTGDTTTTTQTTDATKTTTQSTDQSNTGNKTISITDSATGNSVTITDPQNFSESAKAIAGGDAKQVTQVQAALPEIIKAISSVDLAHLNPAAARAQISNIVLQAAFNSSVTSGTVIENMKQFAFQYYATTSAPQQQSQLSLLQLITPQKNR